MKLSDTRDEHIRTVAAVATGLALPLIPLGVAVTQGLLALALLLLLALVYGDDGVQARFIAALKMPVAWAFMTMFAIWLLVTPWSNGPWHSFTTVVRTALYLLGAVLIWANLCRYDGFYRCALSVFMGASVAMLAAACLALTFPEPFAHAMGLVMGKDVLADKYFKVFASSLLCLLPVVFWGGRHLGGRWRYAVWVMFPAALYVFFGTESRSSLAGAIAMLGVAALVIAWAGNQHSRIMLAAAAAFATAALGWLWWTRRFVRPTEGTFLPDWLIDPHRQYIWRYTFDQFLEAPWTGHGVNRINYVEGSQAFASAINAAILPSHPHNWILEILSETGAFGFSAIIAVLTLLAIKLLQRYKATHDPASLVLLALSAAFFGSNLFNFSVWATWWELTYFIAFALIAAGVGTTSKNAPH